MARILIAYYSLKGNTRTVATRVADLGSCEMEKIMDIRSRAGLFGFIGSRLDAVSRKETIIAEPTQNPSDFDVVVLGTPMWAGHIAPAIRTYINKNRYLLNRIAVIGSYPKDSGESLVSEIAEVSGRQPIAHLLVHEGDAKGDDYLPRAKEFVAALHAPPRKQPEGSEQAGA
jgi:flavodoxin